MKFSLKTNKNGTIRATGAMANALFHAMTDTQPDKATARTWSIQVRKDGLGSLPDRNSLEIVENIENGGGQIVIVGKHTGIDCLNLSNATLIVKAVNEYNALEAVADRAQVCIESPDDIGYRADLSDALDNLEAIRGQKAGGK